jgi:hypothetical protein
VSPVICFSPQKIVNGRNFDSIIYKQTVFTVERRIESFLALAFVLVISFIRRSYLNFIEAFLEIITYIRHPDIN